MCYRQLHAPGGAGLWGMDKAANALTFGGTRQADQAMNTVAAHQQIFYEDGTNSGYGANGIFSENNAGEYEQCSGNYDDSILKQAERNVQNTGAFIGDS